MQHTNAALCAAMTAVDDAVALKKQAGNLHSLALVSLWALSLAADTAETVVNLKVASAKDN